MRLSLYFHYYECLFLHKVRFFLFEYGKEYLKREMNIVDGHSQTSNSINKVDQMNYPSFLFFYLLVELILISLQTNENATIVEDSCCDDDFYRRALSFKKTKNKKRLA